MGAKGSKLQRTVDYFREGPLDEVRVAFQLVKEVVEGRLARAKSDGKRQVTSITTPRRKRRTRAEIAADKAQAGAGAGPGTPPEQTSIQEKHGNIVV